MAEKKEEIKLEVNTLLVIALGAMFVLAAFQTLQLSEMKQSVSAQAVKLDSLEGASLSGSAVQPQQATQTQTTALPQSLQNIPDMVGGC